MKWSLRNASILALLAVAGVGSLACSHPRRDDWRHPGPTPCASDADCPGGRCTLESGTTRGTCSPASLPALPAADAGAHPPAPGPNIQPSSSDIQI